MANTHTTVMWATSALDLSIRCNAFEILLTDRPSAAHMKIKTKWFRIRIWININYNIQTQTHTLSNVHEFEYSLASTYSKHTITYDVAVVSC